MPHAHLPALTALLRQVDYPATNMDLVLTATRDGATAPIVQLVQSLPARSYNGTWDVRNALTKGKSARPVASV
jgi:hypothetical protein